MTTLREVAQQALEALEEAHPKPYNEDTRAHVEAITALRKALAQPEPRNQCGETCERAKLCAVCARGLEGAAQAPCDIAEDGVCEVIDCCRNSPQQDQEPALIVEKEPDYMSRGHFYEGSKPFIDPTLVWKLPIGTKLYAHPPRREWQGLTEEEIIDAVREADLDWHRGWTLEDGDPNRYTQLARAIEAKLKEKNA